MRHLYTHKITPATDRQGRFFLFLSHLLPTTHSVGHKDVLEAIRRCGRYRVPDLPPEVLAAIRQIGGWSSICGAMEFDLRPGGPIFQKFKAALTI